MTEMIKTEPHDLIGAEPWLSFAYQHRRDSQREQKAAARSRHALLLACQSHNVLRDCARGEDCPDALVTAISIARATRNEPLAVDSSPIYRHRIRDRRRSKLKPTVLEGTLPQRFMLSARDRVWQLDHTR